MGRVRTLRFGDAGEDVRQVQADVNRHFAEPSFREAFKQELIKEKLYHAPLQELKRDGKFGPLTRAAVIAFQRDKHLRGIDGVVGPETMSALYPFAVYHVQTLVVPSPSPAPSRQSVPPVSHPALPTRVQAFPGIRSPVPAPFVPPLSLPSVPGSLPPSSASYQLKAGVTRSFPLSGSPYNTLSLDWVGLIRTPPRVTAGVDFGLGFPLADGKNSTATVSWAITWWPTLFSFGRFDLLGISAKTGVGMGGSGAVNPEAAENLALQARWNVLESGSSVLSLLVQGSRNYTLSLQGTSFSVSVSDAAFIGLQYTTK